MKRSELSAKRLRLPACALPRCGDSVVWRKGSSLRKGRFVGHRGDGTPVVISATGYPDVLGSFDSLRFDPDQDQLPPCWHRLPIGGRILKPSPAESQVFAELLDQRTFPGPKYIELVTEIHHRGFEVALVGGTVRDVLSGQPTHDVDLATTMPLFKMLPFANDMYNDTGDGIGARNNGHLHLGGKRGTAEPFVDINVFRCDAPGDSSSLFGGGFDKDIQYRDFSLNSLYYDPINRALIDPTGSCLHDAEARRLNFICSCGEEQDGRFLGKLVVRFFKFLMRGLSSTEDCSSKVRKHCLPALRAMSESHRVSYTHAQVLAKAAPGKAHEALQAFREQFVRFGAESYWQELFEPIEHRILAYTPPKPVRRKRSGKR